MSRYWRGVILKYGLSLVFGALCVWGVFAANDYASADKLERYKILCDAFTVPGLLMTMFGAMLWVAGEGALDGISWAAINMVKLLIPGMAGTREPYGDFLERRRGNKVRGFGFLLHVGLLFLAAAIVFLILFIKNDPTW